MGCNTCPRPSFGLVVFFWMAVDCSVPSGCWGSPFPPATAEVWCFASWLQSVLCCPHWALPIIPCLPGCPRCPGDAGWQWSPPILQHSPLTLQAGQGALYLHCCPGKGAWEMEPRKERADHKARQQQRGREPGFRSLANKSISNSRLEMVKGAGRPGTWLEVS